MRSKAWLAARGPLRLARLRSTRAAAPGLLGHAEVTKNIILFSMGPKLTYPTVCLFVLACDRSIGSVYVAGETEDDDDEPAASGGAGAPSSSSGAAMATPRITASWDRSYVPRTRRYGLRQL